MNGQIVQVKGTGGNWVQVLPPNPRRVSLTLSGNPTSACQWWIGSAPPASVAGMNLGFYATPYIVRRSEVGDLITQAVYGQTGATAYLTAIEGLE